MHHRHWLNRISLASHLLGLVLVFASSAALAQYQSTLLVSDKAGAKHTDPLLKNAWGLAYAPSAPFWVSDEADWLVHPV
jgi:hypothetical protein